MFIIELVCSDNCYKTGYFGDSNNQLLSLSFHFKKCLDFTVRMGFVPKAVTNSIRFGTLECFRTRMEESLGQIRNLKLKKINKIK